ncbi:prolipoprotein diacylglyceryl transferase [Geosporobacter ferrireducens]|uniref:Phosphatidylglycerol--prolipoprotein diacylglyceryl transferase n=1 Tax=Geosporobacter ferrireducens TaxID=1424294 RepID=A0A1D8GE58_9FIRM|nr:prolipoprotein diacylglyceryl transferase [Geosporobacter ferrireducens]AOT69188.1 prolipoprotein diacylglyceryl transferase [Geosporobacter ferrireducens]MTI56865.1 prolipoprotein diacylglyceryl transferase [Geosporobacter ferrireducens]
MKPIFSIGHFTIYLFGITIMLGMLAGLWIMTREAKRKGLEQQHMLDLALYTIFAGIIGARLYYVVAFNFEYYMRNPLEILMIQQGGLSIQGALIGGALFGYWYTKKKEIPFWRAADTFAPGIILGQAIGRIGCDVFGIPMKNIYPWGININNQILHPAQMYEMLLDLILFGYLWRNRDRIQYDGQLFIKYIVGFSMNRFVVEFFRTNPIIFGPFSIAHLTSVGIIAIAFIAGKIIKRKQENLQIDVANETAAVRNGEYILIPAIAAVGIWFYYFIHGTSY